MDKDLIALPRRFCFLFGVFAALLVFNSPAVYSTLAPVDNIDDAVKHYQYGEFQKSYKILLKLSRTNNPRAFFLLGKMHERGDGVFRDESKAIAYYKLAASFGSERASQRIDQLRDSENSVVVDWYLESAWDGDVESEFNLGYLYESGMSIRIDETLAMQWYEEAANQQHSDAQLRLGMMLISSAEVDRDVRSGKKWIVDAGKNGNEVARTIDLTLFKTNKKRNILQIIRGLRTLEHADPENMLRVLKASIANDNSGSIFIVARPTPDSTVTSSKISPLVLLSNKATANQANAKLPVQNLEISLQGVGIPRVNGGINWILWLISGLLLFALVVVMVRYMVRRRLRKITLPNWGAEGSKGTADFVLNRKEFVCLPGPNQTIQRVQHSFSLSAKNQSQNVTNSPVVNYISQGSLAPSFVQATSFGDIEPLLAKSEAQKIKPRGQKPMHRNKKSIKVNSKPVSQAQFSLPSSELKTPGGPHQIFFDASDINMSEIKKRPKDGGEKNADEFIAKISVDEFDPKQDVDLQLTTGKSSAQAFIEKMKTTLAEAKVATDIIVQQSVMQQQIIKGILNQNVSKQYIDEQARELEAARVNNIEAGSEARFNIGLMFFKGDGVVQNIELAVKWFKRAAEQGNIDAERELNTLYQEYPEYEIDDSLDHDDIFEQRIFAERSA